LCGGHKKPGTTTFTTDLGFGVVVVRKVKATICSQCGADWLADSEAEKLEHIIDDAKKNHRIVEIVSF
jgi:YgiT-type zinc finger domain-containing protein